MTIITKVKELTEAAKETFGIFIQLITSDKFKEFVQITFRSFIDFNKTMYVKYKEKWLTFIVFVGFGLFVIFAWFFVI